MAYEIVKINREDVRKLDAKSFLDIDRIEKELLLDTVIYIAFHGGEPAGIITLEPVGSIYRTSYFYVPEEHRRRGIGRELFSAVRSYDPKIYINDSMEGYDTMLAAFEHMDIGEIRDMSAYTFMRSPETIGYIKDMKEQHGDAILKRMASHGYVCNTMQETAGSILEKLGEEMGTAYDEDKNPEHIKGLCKGWSYIVSKDDEPAAFIACVKDGDTLTVELLSAHKKYRGTGAAMVAMFSVIDRVMKDESISKVKAYVMKENDDVTRLVDDKLKRLITERRQLKVFELS